MNDEPCNNSSFLFYKVLFFVVSHPHFQTRMIVVYIICLSTRSFHLIDTRLWRTIFVYVVNEYLQYKYTYVAPNQ